LNIVFDFAGVLFTWQPQALLARLLPHHAGDSAAASALFDTFFEGYGGDWGEFDRGTIEPGALADRIARRTGISRADVRRVIDAVPHELTPIEPTIALVRRLHTQGHALFFLSNMPAPYADHLETEHAFLDLFRAGLFSARVRMIKPEPAIFAHAQRVFAIDPADTLFIDDIAHNAQAARDAGWRALHFIDPQQCEAELMRAGVLPAAD